MRKILLRGRWHGGSGVAGYASRGRQGEELKMAKVDEGGCQWCILVF